jgi:EmrB/QacA subfamily drug resistance transporter
MTNPDPTSDTIAPSPAALSTGLEPAPLASAARLSYYPWLIVGTTCIGAFIGQLDASIVQLTLPTLEREFSAGLGAVSWVAIAYMLAYTAILPIFARLSEILGRKLLYMVGYAVFALASALCGMVSSLGLLIFFRVLQGVGGAMLGANSMTILVKASGSNRRGTAMGMFAAAQAIGISAGPVVGGVLLATLGWRSVFWVSVPFGILGVIIGWLILPRTTGPVPDKRFDWWGALLLTPALTSLVIILSEFHSWGLQSTPLRLAILAAILLLPLFVWRELRTPSPLIDLHLFRIPAFSGGIIAVNLSYALLYSSFFLLSFAFIRGFHEPPLTAGLKMAMVPIALGLTAPISGALCERLGVRGVTTAGMAFCLGAIFLLSLVLRGVLDHGPAMLAALALFGLGLGVFIAPNNSATMGAAPPQHSGEAGGLLNLMRVLGCALGVAAASTTLSWRLENLSGVHDQTLGTPTQLLLSAANQVLVLLAAFALVAGAAALLRGSRQPASATAATAQASAKS